MLSRTSVAPPQPPPKHPMATTLRPVATNSSPHTYNSDRPFTGSDGHTTMNALPVNEKHEGGMRNLSWIHHVPTFKQWVQDSWLDLIAVIGAAILVSGFNY
jgi:hypothetical protein